MPALLDDADLRKRLRDAVDWERAETMLGGGIRIENNVLVTADGNEVLTADVPLLAQLGQSQPRNRAPVRFVQDWARAGS